MEIGKKYRNKMQITSYFEPLYKMPDGAVVGMRIGGDNIPYAYICPPELFDRWEEMPQTHTVYLVGLKGRNGQVYPGSFGSKENLQSYLDQTGKEYAYVTSVEVTEGDFKEDHRER